MDERHLGWDESADHRGNNVTTNHTLLPEA